MSRRQFFLLAVVAGVVIALVALLAPHQAGRDEGAGAVPVLPGLKARVNEIDRLTAKRADGEVSLVRGAEGWVVESLEGYPADWDALRGLLADLAEMSVAENKTSNPAYFDRLGVEDLSADDAAGALVRAQAGSESWAVIVGNEADRQDGQYMRALDSQQSVLADRTLEIPDEPVDWAQDMILDYGPGLVAEVSIEHADGEVLRISKVSADESNFTLRTLPAGREPQSAFQVNSLANPFSMLRMVDVRKDPGEAASEVATVQLVLFSGERFRLEFLDWEEQRWIRVRRVSGPKAPEAEGADRIAQAGHRPDWEGWVYRISDNRAEILTRRVEDLLKPREESGGGTP